MYQFLVQVCSIIHLRVSEHVTMRDIVSNYIYPNTLKVIKITGADIKMLLNSLLLISH